jgi:hypothetical protein
MDFSDINKKSSDSFHKQRNMLKQLAQGKALKCEKCNGALFLDLATSEPGKGLVKCNKGCTNIILDLGA